MPESPSALIERIASRAAVVRTGAMVWRVWGDGRPLVLLHGASGSWTHWIRNVMPLAERFRVLAGDMPGFGDSDLVPGEHTAEVLGDAVAAGIEWLVPSPAPLDIAGFSFGGIIAGLAAARLGARVRHLVLLGAGGLGLSPAPPRELAPLRRDMTPAEVQQAHRENLRILMFGDERRIDDLALHIQVENLRRARFRAGTIPESDALVRALPAVPARLSSIVGRRDAFMAGRLEECRRVLASFQPDLDFRVIEDAGHWTIYEAAEQATGIVQEMLGAH